VGYFSHSSLKNLPLFLGLAGRIVGLKPVTDPSSSFSETTSSTKWTKTSIRAVNLTHVLARLDELDAGSGERMVLMARYEQSCLVVSYKDVINIRSRPSSVVSSYLYENLYMYHNFYAISVCLYVERGRGDTLMNSQPPGNCRKGFSTPISTLIRPLVLLPPNQSLPPG
jgi:hypothetical protein